MSVIWICGFLILAVFLFKFFKEGDSVRKKLYATFIAWLFINISTNLLDDNDRYLGLDYPWGNSNYEIEKFENKFYDNYDLIFYTLFPIAIYFIIVTLKNDNE